MTNLQNGCLGLLSKPARNHSSELNTSLLHLIKNPHQKLKIPKTSQRRPQNPSATSPPSLSFQNILLSDSRPARQHQQSGRVDSQSFHTNQHPQSARASAERKRAQGPSHHQQASLSPQAHLLPREGLVPQKDCLGQKGGFLIQIKSRKASPQQISENSLRQGSDMTPPFVPFFKFIILINQLFNLIFSIFYYNMESQNNGKFPGPFLDLPMQNYNTFKKQTNLQFCCILYTCFQQTLLDNALPPPQQSQKYAISTSFTDEELPPYASYPILSLFPPELAFQRQKYSWKNSGVLPSRPIFSQTAKKQPVGLVPLPPTAKMQPLGRIVGRMGKILHKGEDGRGGPLWSKRKSKEAKKLVGIQDVGAVSGWAPKQAPPAVKNALLYQNQIDCVWNSTPKMKQHNLRTIPPQKMLQNVMGKSEPKSSQENDEQHSIQELKLMNNQTQFLFKKQERTSRQRPKDSLPLPKSQNQTPSRLPAGTASYPLKKNEMLSEKLSSSDRLTVKQQYEQIRAIQKGKRQNKLQKSPTNCIDLASDAPSSHLSKQLDKKSKKQTKQAKKNQKEKEKVPHWGPTADRHAERPQEDLRAALPSQLIELFREKYSYYLIDNKITFPIDDHLFLNHPQLQEQRTGVLISPERLITPLAPTFSKELQIWNMIVEHAAFFELDQDVTIHSVAAILSDPTSPQYTRLFKNLHKFYINDVIFQKYDEASGEDYYSFISLWRYSEENSFLDKLFHTSWNKFLLFYISLQRHYVNPQIIDELHQFQAMLSAQLSQGYFSPPRQYSDLLDYLIFLVNMCFETHTFKSLINNKMLFFRDNNKMKNQLLEEKKNVENRLWELKEAEKAVVKREKTNSKMLKKEQKQHDEDKLVELHKENQEIAEEKAKIVTEREKLQLKIIQIDNKIYELCCLPEFSNVWLLGEDKHKNLYWFIREQESAIYRECRKTGQWGMIEYENIELFHQQLNLRGIKEHKLYEKILYYKQLGYIKTERDEPLLAGTPKSNPQSSSSSPNKPLSPCASQAKPPSQEVSDFQRFNYMQVGRVTVAVVKQMILKSESMMSKYLFERNSKWTSEENRQEYIHKMMHHDLTDYESLTQELRTFNEKICVVQINIRVTNEQSAQVESKTRKIQTKIWGINEKYKHFWYDYSRRCRSLSDLHFLVSVLYLTIEKYVTKTRKPNNTKYFFKTVELGEAPHDHQENFAEEELL